MLAYFKGGVSKGWTRLAGWHKQHQQSRTGTSRSRSEVKVDAQSLQMKKWGKLKYQ